MHCVLAALVSVAACSVALADQVLDTHAHNGTGTVLLSATMWEDGSDWDQFRWDRFRPASDSTLTQISWRGGYGFGRPPGNLYGFEIEIYGSISGDSQPHLLNLLYSRRFVGDANETFVGRFGTTDMYDYSVTLPTPMDLQGGTAYWVMIAALQPIVFPPDWGLAISTADDSRHFLFIEGCPCYQSPGYDLVMTLIGQSAACTPDLNNDGVLDFFDVQAFLSAFAAQDPAADFAGDGVLDFFDVQAFLQAFAAGCP